MKAITVWHPWASLLACGAKKYETRSWPTKYRGPIAIHAALKDPHRMMQSLPHLTQKAMFDSLYEHYGIPSGALQKMKTGVIIATAELVDCWECIGPDRRGWLTTTSYVTVLPKTRILVNRNPRLLRSKSEEIRK